AQYFFCCDDPALEISISCTPGSFPNERRRSMAKTKKRKHRKLERSLPVMRPNAGGVDIGATEICVAVPADRDTESVRSFPTFTQDLHQLADWLQQCLVDTVAMESTGVYWISLFQILEAPGNERQS